ncbi:hypothetical protein [Yoonia sp. 208BN28-4]|uniref:hypothetical protein n=1 Tax=Yoonia sp. 208BN28-4 TaxID=3126505 RepID=UPI0030EC9E7A
MPMFGIVAWMVPLLSSGQALTGRIGLYIFGVWIVLIVLSALITSRMSRDADAPDGTALTDDSV